MPPKPVAVPIQSAQRHLPRINKTANQFLRVVPRDNVTTEVVKVSPPKAAE